MTYTVGVDLGTAFTAAAVHRGEGTRPEIVMLGARGGAVPSAVLVRDDGVKLVGDAAVQRGIAEPERMAREFKRRLGDPAPMFVAGAGWSPEALMALQLRATLDQVAAQEGAWPEVIVLTHPANWGAYKLELLTQVTRLSDLWIEFQFLSEPEAAAMHYSSTDRVPPGAIVAVYDLGGGTFDAAILRKTETGFETLGMPEGIERLGGIDFDAAVFEHLRIAVPDALSQLEADDPISLAAAAQLRASCTLAKEALSSDTDTTISIMLPNYSGQIRLTRTEFEATIRPQLDQTVRAMARAVQSAGIEARDVDRVLLVGGSSRIPLVAQLLAGEFARPIAVDTNPKYVVALGAALAGHLRSKASGIAPGAATPPSALSLEDDHAPDEDDDLVVDTSADAVDHLAGLVLLAAEAGHVRLSAAQQSLLFEPFAEDDLKVLGKIINRCSGPLRTLYQEDGLADGWTDSTGMRLPTSWSESVLVLAPLDVPPNALVVIEALFNDG